MFWDVTPCSPLNFNRRFGGTYRLHLQGHANSAPVFYLPSVPHIYWSSDWLSILLATCLLAGLLNLFLRPWRWRPYVPPKRRLKLNRLHGVISEKMILWRARCGSLPRQQGRLTRKRLMDVSLESVPRKGLLSEEVSSLPSVQRSYISDSQWVGGQERREREQSIE
jgi:hypothetical protein